MMDPEMVRQQQQAELEALHPIPAALPHSSVTKQARLGRASLFLAAERLALADPESWSVVTGQFERIARAPIAAANFMAGLGMTASQYGSFVTQMASAMLFAPANLLLAARPASPFGMTAPMPWWPRI